MIGGSFVFAGWKIINWWYVGPIVLSMGDGIFYIFWGGSGGRGGTYCGRGSFEEMFQGFRKPLKDSKAQIAILPIPKAKARI